jgi:hypothetical protein
MHKESLAVRAGSVRPRGLAGRIKPPKSVRRFTVARFEYVPKPGQNLLPLVKYARKNGADGRSAAYKTKRKNEKKAKKKGWRAEIYGLAAQQGSGGRRVVAASASLGAGLGVHFMPAAAETVWGQPCMHTFCPQNCRRVSG